MRKILLFLMTMVMCLSSQAQKETNNWTFGQNCGLTWNTTRSLAATGLALYGIPNATLDGLPTSFSTSIVTQEGCYSLSDANGNLLFYSDGMTVWNKNHEIMTNGTGMKGNYSSAQSGIIFPYPGQANKYISVSIGEHCTNGLSYSVVDMAQSGGLGAVVTNQKNIDLTGGSGGIGETVTSIRHANGIDYWIVALGRGNSTYLNAWLVTSSGVAASTSVITHSPVTMSGTSCSRPNGYIKFTADSKHFAVGGEVDRNVMYGDFDNSTGKFSNIKGVGGPSFNIPYGIEFSKSMKYLYIGGNGCLYVYNFEALLASSTPYTVPYKEYFLGVENGYAIQLAPDGRMYMCAYLTSSLFVIDNPDEYDNLKIYQLPDGFLGSGECRVGLPSFAASWFAADTKEKSFVCTGNDFKYTVEITMSGVVADQPAKLEWNFGDGSAIVTQNIVTGTTIYKQTHNYAATGKYTITITPRKADGTALAKTTLPTNVVDCVFKTNRMIRTGLLNTAQQQ